MATPVLYSVFYLPAIKYLKNLSGILAKAEKFADEKGMKHEDMIKFRLIEDMRSLDYQVQSCSNTIKWALVRFHIMEDVKLEDNETTFEQLQQRIATTVKLLEDHASKPEVWQGKEAQEVLMKTAIGTFRVDDGITYVSQYALANFHFHLSTAYCILRHLGVDVGIFDYLGKDTFVKVEDS